jgi:hypothetical protein
MAIKPIVDQYRGFRNWNYKELYMPDVTQGQVVPNVDDMVTDWDSNTIHRVISVNYANNTFTLQATNLGKFNGYTTQDILTTSGPGDVSEAYRIYVNNEVTPHTLNFDTRLRLFGTEVAYVKVFRGVKITVDGDVMSAIFNSSNVKTSENIPCELVMTPNAENYGMKTPQSAWASDTVNDGEILTVVAYNIKGDVTSISRMVAVNTDVIRTINQESKTITNIDLVSPYLSTTDRSLLQYPLNMPLQSDMLQGRVTYSNGDAALLPVDGTKFKLLGIDSFIATEVGQTFNLQLVYTLSNGEYAVGVSQPLPERVLKQPYRIQTVESDDAYMLKLFFVPVWDNTTNAWVLNYYLYNIERTQIIDVTSYIEVGSQSARFNGAKYDAPQNLTVSLNMASLGTSYKYYRHVQNFTIQLYGPGNNSLVSNYFYIRYTNDTLFGQGMVARITADPEVITDWRVDVANGYTIVKEWLDKVYSVLSPLYYPNVESAPPEPTHVRVRIGNSWMREIPIADILKPITGVNAGVAQGQPVRLEFFARSTVRDQELALASLTMVV